MISTRASASPRGRSTLSSKRPESRGSSARSGGSRHVRYAVVGLGHIAQAAVLPAFAHAKKNSTLVALVSDDVEKLRKIGRKYKVEFTASYDGFEDLLDSGEIDAAYIALPNHLHAEYAMRAARKGVHVLCEKPMATSVEDCRRMIAARDDAGIKMMVAYRLHFEKANLEAVRIAQSGKLGDLRYFQSTFSFNVKPDNIRTQAETGGGPLFDIGTYCINAARYLFRQEPTHVCAFTVARENDKRFREVEECASVMLRFPDERLASFIVSFGAAATATYRIVGSEGDLCVDNAYEYTEPITHYLTIKGKTRTKAFGKRDQFAPELLYLSDCVLNDKDIEPGAEEGLIDVQIIESIRQSASEGGAPIAIHVTAEDAPLMPAQEIRRRTVPREPELVRAASASAE